MYRLSLKNRIAFYYIISTAMLIFLVFVAIHSLISFAVFSKVDDHIDYEVDEYIEKIEFVNNNVKLIDKHEWIQREHNEVTVDPVFLEITNNKGQSIEKSENLKNQNLLFTPNLLKKQVNDIKISGQLIRQIQVPLYDKDKVDGYLLVAVSLEEATLILDKLKTVLYFSFPIVLLLLFFVARLIAGSSIKPINAIIETSNKITRDNLKARIDLPKNKDELYILSETINSLLNRIENTIEREKRFTSDASHELRTPLAVIKGTLEVLIRKQRNPEEYQDKINFCIAEVDRINNLVDQLLILARFENQKLSLKLEKISLNNCVSETINRFESRFKVRNIKITTHFDEEILVESDFYFMSIILHNLISNALKYSVKDSIVEVNIHRTGSKVILKVIDNGIGIAENELDKVFNPFFRTTTTTNHPQIKGTGLGLSIVKRLCNLLSIEIVILSKENVGTTVILSIP